MIRSIEIGNTDALNINLGMAKVFTICILPKRERPRHFHKLIVFLSDFKVFLKFNSSLCLAS